MSSEGKEAFRRYKEVIKLLNENANKNAKPMVYPYAMAQIVENASGLDNDVLDFLGMSLTWCEFDSIESRAKAAKELAIIASLAKDAGCSEENVFQFAEIISLKTGAHTDCIMAIVEKEGGAEDEDQQG